MIVGSRIFIGFPSEISKYCPAWPLVHVLIVARNHSGESGRSISSVSSYWT